jgi:hypothetical protein
VELERQDPVAVMSMRTLGFPREEVRRHSAKKKVQKEKMQKELERTRGARKVIPPVSKKEIDAEIKKEREEEKRVRIAAKKAAAAAAAQSQDGQSSDTAASSQDGNDFEESWWEDPDRSILLPIEKHGGVSWSAAWNRYQNELVPNPHDRVVVVYGHDAKNGLQVGEVEQDELEQATSDKSSKKDNKKTASTPTVLTRYAFGLDFGCVYGRQLSAMIIQLGDNGLEHHIVQIECAKP